MTKLPDVLSMLRLDRENREIKDAIRKGIIRDTIKIVDRVAVRPEDFVNYVGEVRPSIVHFSGHGTEDGRLCVEDTTGQSSKMLSIEFLDSFFKNASEHVKCVVLNTCCSSNLLSIIGKHIDYVIGMKGNISDAAAIHFSIGFYSHLGTSKNVTFEQAFNYGRLMIQAEDESGQFSSVPTIAKRTHSS